MSPKGNRDTLPSATVRIATAASERIRAIQHHQTAAFSREDGSSNSPVPEYGIILHQLQQIKDLLRAQGQNTPQLHTALPVPAQQALPALSDTFGHPGGTNGAMHMTKEELMHMDDLSDAFGTESRLHRTSLELQHRKFDTEQLYHYRVYNEAEQLLLLVAQRLLNERMRAQQLYAL